MSEEMLENLILGYIAKELKDEIQIGRQVNLAKTIMQSLRIQGVVGRSEQSICPECENPYPHVSKQGNLSCEDCGYRAN